MHRHDLDQTRLAMALTVTAGELHTSATRRAAFTDAHDLHAALEDAEITEASLAMAMHGAWCSESRTGSFHAWSRHRQDAGKLLDALDDPGLDARLLTLADESDPDDRPG
jgi:hypothetical protein